MREERREERRRLSEPRETRCVPREGSLAPTPTSQSWRAESASTALTACSPTLTQRASNPAGCARPRRKKEGRADCASPGPRRRIRPSDTSLEREGERRASRHTSTRNRRREDEGRDEEERTKEGARQSRVRERKKGGGAPAARRTAAPDDKRRVSNKAPSALSAARRKEGPEREGEEGSRRGRRQEILEDPIGRRSRQWRQRRTRVRTTVRVDREGDSKSRWSTGAHPRGRMGAIPSQLTKIQGLFLRRRLPRNVWGPKSWKK